MFPIHKKHHRESGFTLIELVLYTALVGTIIGTLVSLHVMMVRAQSKANVIREVEQQGAQIMTQIQQALQNAEDITSPNEGNTANQINIDALASANDPTIFDLSGNFIRITEGVSATVNLNNDRVVASGLTFTNLTRTDTPDIIHIEFTLTHVNTDDINEFDYSQTFRTSTSIR